MVSSTSISMEACESRNGRYLHAVTPIMVTDGRDIDALVLGLSDPQLVVNAEPVLKGEDGPHGRAV